MPIWFAVLIVGIVEGITEFLPVSSTGHMLIIERWLPKDPNVFNDLFNVVIQCGAVLAVLPLFPERLNQFFHRWREKPAQDYLLKIFIAFAITGAGGLILEKKHFKLPEELTPVAIALGVGGVLFLLVEGWLRKRTQKDVITWPIVVAVGLGQLVAAVFPGSSRSGTTILLALILGLNRVAATEFSFLVGIPTMLAAGGLKMFKALHHPPADAHQDWLLLGVGFLVAAVVSFIAVKWLLIYVRTHTFVAFGWYRIALAILIAAMLLLSGKPGTSHVALGTPAASAQTLKK
jgi:undecaprenyl-diphosphatase